MVLKKLSRISKVIGLVGNATYHNTLYGYFNMSWIKVICVTLGLSVLFACTKSQPKTLALASGQSVEVLSISKKYSFNSKKWTFKMTYRMNRKFESLDDLRKKQDEIVGDMKKFWAEAHYLADNEGCGQARITAEMTPESIMVIGSNTLSVTADFKKIEGKWDLFEGKMD